MINLGHLNFELLYNSSASRNCHFPLQTGIIQLFCCSTKVSTSPQTTQKHWLNATEDELQQYSNVSSLADQRQLCFMLL